MFLTSENKYTTTVNKRQGEKMEKEMLGEKIMELRKKMGLSQVELSAKAGISTNTLSVLENGKTYPRKTTLKCVLGALGISIDDL